MRATLVVIAFFISFIVGAQILDTTDVHTYKTLQNYQVSEQGLINLEEDSISIDTSLKTLGRSYGAMHENFAFLDLGFEGSPLLKLTNLPVRNLSLELGMNGMDYYFYDFELNRYHSDRPFTRLNYSQGANELIFIDVTHGQEISRRLTFGLDYRRLKNQNFYYSNISNADRVRFSNLFNTKFYTGYYNKDRSYEMLFGFLWNKNKNIESGGLEDPALFELLSGREKTNNNPSYLGDANSQIAEHGFKLTQFFRLKSSPLDTNNKHDLRRFKSQVIWNTELNYQRSEYTDNLPDSAFYGLKLAEVHDSILHRKFSSGLSYMIKQNNAMYIAGLQYSNDHIYQDSSFVRYNSLYTRIETKQHLFNWDLKAKLDFGLVGYNQSDYKLDVKFKRRFNKSLLALGWTESSIRQNYIQSQFSSSYISWQDSSWQSENNRRIVVKYKRKMAKSAVYIKASVQQVKGLMYFNDSSILQSNELSTLSNLTLAYKLKMKHWGGNAQFTYQTSSNQQVLPRPELFGQAELYLQLKLFKKLLNTQLGVSSRAMSEFNAPIYDPRIRQWRNSSDIFEYYSPIQLFMRAKIKSFYFGFNVFHIQQGFMGESYYSSPNYPMMPRAFRLNIQWDLAN
ncbi:MAG: hypothetical protein JXR19_09025 [Bacteroidia bacterium]